MSFMRGQKVKLKADAEEGWPEEFGTVDGKSGKTTYIVTVDKKYRQGGADDGLREVSLDQLEPV